MPRGRLINPILAELARLDTSTTETSGGYDPDFKSLKTTYPQGVRTSSRKELAPIRVRCQVEPAAWEAQRQTDAGNSPSTLLVLCFHYVDLERASLIDAHGDPLIRVNDRVLALYTTRGALVQRCSERGFYATKVDLGSGWLSAKRNILLVTFENRAQGLTS